MGNSILTNDQLVIYPAVATTLAGGALTGDTRESDRFQDVSPGEIVGHMTVNIGLLPAANSKGYFEYIVFKAQRQFTTPVVGTDPIPSDAEIIAGGMQGEYRKNMPGWVIQFGQWPVTENTVALRTIKINWAKFKMAGVRSGDFFGIALFNRTSATVVTDWQARYWVQV